MEKDSISQVSFSYTIVFYKQVNTGYLLISFCLENSFFYLGKALHIDTDFDRKFLLFHFPKFSYGLYIVP